MTTRGPSDEVQRKLESYKIQYPYLSKKDIYNIHLACLNDDVDVLIYLIACGVDVNLPRKYRLETPLMDALDRGNINCVKILLDNGADALRFDIDNLYPIHFAAANGNINCLQLIIKAYPPGVKLLTNCGYTALNIAYNKERYDCCKILLEAGSNVDALTISRITLLDHAIRYNKCGFAKLFIDHGANINKVDGDIKIPNIVSYIYHRGDCRLGARAILQLQYRHSQVIHTGSVPCGRDVLRLIAKLVWAHRHI